MTTWSEVARPVTSPLARLAGEGLGRATGAATNLVDYLVHGRLADLERWPREEILTADGWTLHRYVPMPGVTPSTGDPVLIVPPLGAPDFAFDLRRGGSLVEDLLRRGRTVEIVTYASSWWRSGARGLELWVDEIVPTAVRAAAHAHARDVHLVGWSLGGLFVLLAAAAAEGAGRRLPLASITTFGSPVDISAVPLVAPFRSVAEYTGGAVFTAAYRTLGAFPAGLVRLAFQLTSVERYLTKPVTVLTHLDDRELLEQIEAVDMLMANMTAYPGRAFGQIYHQLVRANDLATDRLVVGGREVHLRDITTPVLLVAGTDDVIAPPASVRHAVGLLTSVPDLRYRPRPGGHLGVLAGRRARSGAWVDLSTFLVDHDGA